MLVFFQITRRSAFLRSLYGQIVMLTKEAQEPGGYDPLLCLNWESVNVKRCCRITPTSFKQHNMSVAPVFKTQWHFNWIGECLPSFSLVGLNSLHRKCSLNAHNNNTPSTYSKCLAELSHDGTPCHPSYFSASHTLFSGPPLRSGWVVWRPIIHFARQLWRRITDHLWLDSI